MATQQIWEGFLIWDPDDQITAKRHLVGLLARKRFEVDALEENLRVRIRVGGDHLLEGFLLLREVRI